MKKRKIRCLSTYVKVDGIYNNEVFFPLTGGWASFSLTTCIKCGELFVIDKEDTIKIGIELKQIAARKYCPKCGSNLGDTLEDYPRTFVTERGSIGSFNPPIHIPPDWESKIIEVWELTSS